MKRDSCFSWWAIGLVLLVVILAFIEFATAYTPPDKQSVWLNFGNSSYSTPTNRTSVNLDFLLGEAIPPIRPYCVLLNRTPSDLNDTVLGTFNVLLNCTSPYGINVSKTGDHYWAFATRTVEGGVTPGVPNRWSIRPPANNLAQVDPLLSAYGQIMRAQGRGRKFWYENISGSGDLNLSSWFLADNYSYAADDGHYGYLQITNTSSTTALFNFTLPSIRITAFRQNIPLSYDSLVSEPKKDLTINKNLQVLVYRNDLEAMKGITNYTIITYRNLNLTSTSPTATLRAFYCNSSYSPSGGVTVPLSPNCILINSITPAQATTRIFNSTNSSYSQGTYSVQNSKIGGITATPYHYYYYDTLESNPSRGYIYRYANGSTVTNDTFKDTNRTWTSTTSGASWTQYAGTLDLMEFTVKSANDTFKFGYCVYDLVGIMGCNSTLFSDDITPTYHPISSPNIIEYNSSLTVDDIALDGNHTGIMGIKVGMATQSGNPGAVTHNLTLRYTNGSFRYMINASFNSSTDAPVWQYLNTSLIAAGKYKVNITAFANSNPSDIQSVLTSNNFTIAKRSGNVALILNSTNITYGATVNLTCYRVAGDNLSLTLYLNGTNLTTGGTITYTIPILAAAGYNVSCSYPESENFTAYNNQTNLTVNRATPTINLGTINSTYPSIPTITGNVSVPSWIEGYVNLSINGTQTNRTSTNTITYSQILAAGVYNAVFNYEMSQNYTNASILRTFKVNRGTPTGSIAFSTNPVDELDPVTTTCTQTLGDYRTISLLINGSSATSGYTILTNTSKLSRGTYNWSCVYNESQNYTQTTLDEKILNVTAVGAISYGANISSPLFRMNLSNATYDWVYNGSGVIIGVTNVTSYNNSQVNQTSTIGLFKITMLGVVSPDNITMNISNTAGGPARIKCCNNSLRSGAVILNGTHKWVGQYAPSTVGYVWCWMDWLNATEIFNYTLGVDANPA